MQNNLYRKWNPQINKYQSKFRDILFVYTKKTIIHTMFNISNE